MMPGAFLRRGRLEFPVPAYSPGAAYMGTEMSCISEPAIISLPRVAIRPPTKKEQEFMTLTLKGLDKRGRNAIYSGAAISLRFPVGAFPNKQAPPTIALPDGALAGPKEAKTPREAMTPEQRKAARAAQPKLTLAEKVAKAEARTAALRDKLAKAGAPAQPSI